MSDWDARAYNRVIVPHQEWAETILDRLPLNGDEVVMDAGSGSGKITRRLLERLPRGHVYAVDLSPDMHSVAREQLREFADQVTFVQADLTTVQLPEPVEAIFSSATFHWVLDHPALFMNLFRLLAPGGRLVAQCGGDGNIARVKGCATTVLGREPFASRAAPFEQTWYFATAAGTAEILERVGFEHVDTWLAAAPALFPNRQAYAEFVRAVVLRPYLARLPAELHMAYVDAYIAEAERTGLGLIADYVRLNLSGLKPR